MSTLVIFGIDPGVSGAVSSIGPAGITCDDTPTRAVTGGRFLRRRIDGQALLAAMRRAVREHMDFMELGRVPVLHAFIEDVAVRPQSAMRGRAQTESSLVESRGALIAICDVIGAEVHTVSPQSWQAYYGLVGKDAELRDRGALPESLNTAIRLYPRAASFLTRVRDHNRAESLLIAHYGTRLGGP